VNSRTTANYITNISPSETSGGWSGFNAAMFASLTRHCELEYIGPVSPPSDLRCRIDSKLRRMAGARGSFPHFSERRLERIAREITARVRPDVDVDFFHGSTPWIAYTPPVPYACYLDVCFATYISIYHKRAEFSLSDIARIERREAHWLRRAKRVYFSSQWALEEAVYSYDLDRTTLVVAGMGGHVPVPRADRYAGGHDFLFMALDFAGKGGEVCVDAFRRVRLEVPDARLRIVGAKPPDAVLAIPGIVYEGYLNKTVDAELLHLGELFASSFALVHPTVKDATPQVIVEAAYHGCPVIAPQSFGIPDMVVDGVTGCLVSKPPKASVVAERMLWMVRNPLAYRRMRIAARERALARFTWDQVGDRLAADLVPAVA
jgi:glycosyltransferase involved in cell wall biosynthesis